MAVPKGTRIGGRQKGTRNKASVNIKAIAALHGTTAINRLVHLMNKSVNEQVQVAACKEILDRAYGKAPQAIIGDDDAPIRAVLEVVWGSSNG